MPAQLIDTNVPIAANGGPDVPLTCVLEALDCLQAVQNDGLLVLDDQYRILREYGRHLNRLGQPGAGDFFYQWVLHHAADPAWCTQVTLYEPAEKEFTAFPHHDPALSTFDPSDRKFVALCLAHGALPPIKVAGDRGWPAHAVALAKHGVRVEFLCAESPTYAQKRK